MSMEPRSKRNPTESSSYWYVHGGQINLQKGHASAAAFHSHLTPNLHTGVSGGFPEYNNNSPFLFGLQEPPVYKGKIIGFGSSQKLIYSNNNGDLRAAIYASRSFHVWPMMEFCDRDTAIGLWKTGKTIFLRLLLYLSIWIFFFQESGRLFSNICWTTARGRKRRF